MVCDVRSLLTVWLRHTRNRTRQQEGHCCFFFSILFSLGWKRFIINREIEQKFKSENMSPHNWGHAQIQKDISTQSRSPHNRGHAQIQKDISTQSRSLEKSKNIQNRSYYRNSEKYIHEVITRIQKDIPTWPRSLQELLSFLFFYFCKVILIK